MIKTKSIDVRNGKAHHYILSPADEAAWRARAELRSLPSVRSTKAEAIYASSRSRIDALGLAHLTDEAIGVLVHVLPMMQRGAVPAHIAKAVEIHQYALGQVQMIEASETSTIEAYDPETDPAWPV